MTSARQRVSEIFFAVCDLSAIERNAALDNLCGDDASLRADVLAMLGVASEAATGNLTNIVERGARDASVNIAREFEDMPTQIGAYEILREIGEGGMSVVYEAQQSEPVRRIVALKVIRPGMDTREVIARFESERQALAVMDHPNIAQIFDAGTADNGRPYFVMERVHGVPLTEYCDGRKLSVNDRLGVFLSVCDAIAHAHQKGVVHRDLKPSNILVAEHDGKPQVKVIDFGIAKAVDASLADDPLVTRIGQLIGTPGYMSPEQAGGKVEQIDTRTDVYALGVVLYQLLVGVLPHDMASRSPEELRTLAQDGVTPRPSARLNRLGESKTQAAAQRATDASTLRSALATSLDWVVLKAMARERSRRYQSVFEFKADVRNYLAHRPVDARPPSRRYAMGQFVRRNRSVVTVAGIVLVALIAGVTTATIGLVKATKAEQLARKEAQTATRVTELISDFFRSEDPSVALGNDVKVIDVLDDNVARIADTLVDEPEVQARLLMTIGTLYNNMAEPAKAKPVLQQALAQQERVDRGDTNQTTRAELAEILAQLGESHRQTDAMDDALVTHERALDLRRQHYGERSLPVAASLNDLGQVHLGLGDYGPAQERISQAIDMARPFSPEPEALELLSYSLNSRAVVASLNSNLEAAELAHREALEIKTQLYGEVHPSIATTLSNLGSVLAKQQKYVEAEAVYRHALAMRETVFKSDNGPVGTTINNLALLLYRQGNLDEAETLYRRSLVIRKQEAYPSAAVATTLNNLAGLLRKKGNAVQAEAAYVESVDVRTAVQGATHPNTAITRMNLTEHRLSMGNEAAACADIGEIVGLLTAGLRAGHWRLAQAQSIAGACAIHAGEVERAEELLNGSYVALKEKRGGDAEPTRRALAYLVELYTLLDRPKRRAEFELLLDQTL
ncbi:MAG: tetratricopeptide repeat protein [Gammaproteobacteria bacterium]